MTTHNLVTGAAGFIGSQLVDQLLLQGQRVSGVDNLSLGREEHLISARRNEKFHFYKADVSLVSEAIETLRKVTSIVGPVDIIWHLAASSDIAAGVDDANIDFRNTLQTTFGILEAAKSCGVRKLAFASTSAIYGSLEGLLAEDSGPLLPISNYGATKLASEALISAASESFLDQMWIFRFPNIVGPRSTHGAIHDFIGRLLDRPDQLVVLGDGSQTKPYLHVGELLDALCFIVDKAQDRRNVFNIGPEDDGASVSFMAQKTVCRVAPGATIAYTGGDRGWIGDVPKFRYNTTKLAQLGWKPKLNSTSAVICAIDEIALQRGITLEVLGA